MREKLREMHDFKNKKTKLETLLALHGYESFILPKFHCDLNPKERESGPIAKIYQGTL